MQILRVLYEGTERATLVMTHTNQNMDAREEWQIARDWVVTQGRASGDLNDLLRTICSKLRNWGWQINVASLADVVL